MARPRLPADVLGIFVKAPQVGKVKTRLAAAIGARRAADLYLLGLKASAPELFGHITWSTDAVFRQTMANADALGLRTAVLPELRDVDTVEDARALDLLPSVWSTSERRAIRTAARQLKS